MVLLLYCFLLPLSHILSVSIGYNFSELFLCQIANVVILQRFFIGRWKILRSFIDILIILHILDVIFPESC